jgi:hypothetical protein
MGRVLRHILTATALLGVTTGQGNGLLSGSLKSSSSVKVSVAVSTSVNVKPASVLPKPISSADVGLSVGANNNLNLNLGVGKFATSSEANVKPSSGSVPLLGGLGNVLNGVGGVVNNVASGIGNAVIAVTTPDGSGLELVVSGAAQAVGAVGDTANAAVALVPPVVSGVGTAVSGLGNTLGITALGVTGLVGGLLDVTLDSVFDVVTSTTLGLLTVSVSLNIWKTSDIV